MNKNSLKKILLRVAEKEKEAGIKEQLKKLLVGIGLVVSLFSGSKAEGSAQDLAEHLEYLNKKYTNISTSLTLIDLSKSIIQCDTKNNICEVVGFEILWKNYQLFIIVLHYK